MHHLHLIGRASALYDNLVLAWLDRSVSFEASSVDSFAEAILQVHARRPDWIVYCGDSALSSWEKNPTDYVDDRARVGELARVAAETDAGLAVITSDRVFGGPAMFHDENEPAASDEHAIGLQAIEQAARSFDSDRHRALVVRTHAFGWSAAGDCFAERIWRRLERQEPVERDVQSFATPILASDLAELLPRCFRAQLHGILHVGGAERTSLFRFAQELAAAANFDRRLVRPEAVADDGLLAAARETSLASRRLRHELGVSLPLLRESVARFADQAFNGHRDRLRGGTKGVLSRAA